MILGDKANPAAAVRERLRKAAREGNNSIEEMQRVFREILSQVVVEDGLHFPQNTLQGEGIREDQDYEGVRLRFEVRLLAARIPVQIDIDSLPGPGMLSGKNGGAKRSRTAGLLIANETLYQLSYGPTEIRRL